MLPRFYGTTASPLWLELRSRTAWQATPSWTVYRLAWYRLLPWLCVTFAMVPDADGPGSDQLPCGTAPASAPVARLGRPSAPAPLDVLGCFPSLGRPWCARVCGLLGPLEPVHRCASSVRCVACAVSWATPLLFAGATSPCVVLCVRCPRSLGSCSPVCLLGALSSVSGVSGNFAPVHRCARSVCCAVCAVSWATWLLFTGVLAGCVVLRAQSPRPPGSCSAVCSLAALCCVSGVLGHLAPVHRCACSVRCVACPVSSPNGLLSTSLLALCIVMRARCPGPLGSWSPVCLPGVSCCVWGVLGHLAPVHRCAHVLCCVACAVFWATWLLFIGVPAQCLVLLVPSPGPHGSCSPACSLGALCCVHGVRRGRGRPRTTRTWPQQGPMVGGKKRGGCGNQVDHCRYKQQRPHVDRNTKDPGAATTDPTPNPQPTKGPHWKGREPTTTAPA